jgi:glycerol kinase
VNILAIDQSTSATKAVLFTQDGRMLERVSREHKALYPRPGLVEHDAEELWQNTRSVLSAILEKQRDSIACLAITNQRETFVIFDRETGRPLHNAVVWQCRRGDQVCAELKKHDELVARKTGLRIDSYFSGSKITALLRERPDLAARLREGSAVVSTIDGYLLHRLTGGKVFATDPTNACRTLLYDIRTLKWDAELCDLFEVPIRALPEVRDSTARFGVCDVEGFQGLPIAGVMGDSQAALFAHRCFTPGQAKVTLGTGSSILLTLGEHLPDHGIRTIGWMHKGRPSYGLEGIISYSAATIAWLRDQLGLIASFDEVEPAARAVLDNGGVYLVPAFAGLSAPHWSPDARAAIVGLSGSSTKNHVVRAALESIAYQIKDALDSMKAQGGVDLGVIHADGGATGNRFLMQFIADIVGTPLAVSRVPDFSPLGAAMAGALGMGLYSSLDQLAALAADDERFSPRMPRDAAERLHAGWQVAVQQVLAGVQLRADDLRTS